MARTQAADHDQKRQAITVKAAKLFARSSFAGASISDLAAVCNVSKSLLYHYYASKEEILYDVMNSHVDELLKASEDAVSGDSPKEEFKALTRAFLHLYANAADSQKVLLNELDSLPKKNRTEIIKKQRQLISRVEGILLRHKPSFSRNKAQLRSVVMLYFGMINWTPIWYQSSGPISRNQLADMATNMVLSSL